VEWILSSIGCVKTDIDSDPFDEIDHMQISNKKKKPKRDDESDEEDKDEKGYVWKV